jgi:hypothetical protein
MHRKVLHRSFAVLLLAGAQCLEGMFVCHLPRYQYRGTDLRTGYFTRPLKGRCPVALNSIKASAFRDWRKSLAKNFVLEEQDHMKPKEIIPERRTNTLKSNSKHGAKFESMLQSIGNIKEVFLDIVFVAMVDLTISMCVIGVMTGGNSFFARR